LLNTIEAIELYQNFSFVTRTIIPEVSYVLPRSSSKPIDIRAASWAATNIDRYGDNANTPTPLFFAPREPLITAPGLLGFALSVPLDLRGPRTDAGVTLITRGQVHGFAGHVNASLSRTQNPDPARIPMKSKFHQRLTSAARRNLQNYDVSLIAVKILQIRIVRVNTSFHMSENVEIDNTLHSYMQFRCTMLHVGA